MNLMPSKIKNCTCTGTEATEFQDKLYGKGKRVFNVAEKKKIMTCTCCGAKSSII